MIDIPVAGGPIMVAGLTAEEIQNLASNRKLKRIIYYNYHHPDAISLQDRERLMQQYPRLEFV